MGISGSDRNKIHTTTTITCPHDCPPRTHTEVTQTLTTPLTDPCQPTPPSLTTTRTSLYECLRWSQKTETHHPDDPLICPICQTSSTKWTSTMRIASLPEHLIIRLTREKKDQEDTDKDTRIISFPRKNLRLESGPNGRPTLYDLCGVIRHHGPSRYGGHYTTDKIHKGSWFKCDDSKVKTLMTNQIVGDGTEFMFLYSKPHTTPPPPQ